MSKLNKDVKKLIIDFSLPKKSNPDGCSCKPNYDVRCKCEPPSIANYNYPYFVYSKNYKGNNFTDFQLCPERLDTTIWWIGNEYEWYEKAMEGDFNFLKKILINKQDRIRVKELWIEEQSLEEEYINEGGW